jgi:putative ABC transport system permease protein
MKTIAALAMKDLLKKWALALTMSVLFSTVFASHLTLVAYKNNLSSSYYQLSQDWLVVQKSDGIGEVHGSRLSPDVGQKLVELGYAHPIPEIHQAVGTSLANSLLMAGMSLPDYRLVHQFTLLSGRALVPGNTARLAMVGETIAAAKKVAVGGVIRLRGRDFTVIGIFKTGTFEDNEVWISLSDAQTLINYGQDVSTYFIPDGFTLKEGDNLTEGVSIGRKGETGNLFGHEISSFYDYMGMVAAFAAVAMILTLTNLLWRMAWLHRHDFGILRTLGFGRQAQVFYLLIQAGIIFILGALLGAGLAFGVVITRVQKLTAFGLGLSPAWNLSTILTLVGITVSSLLLGIAFPVIRFNRMSITALLCRD